nr:translocation/assembly module TamB domain-containing protein [Reinekea sp. G2M2-21]
MAVHIRSVAKRTWRSVLRIALMLLIVVVIALSILLGTEGGRINLLQQGVALLRVWSGQTIEVSGIRSPSLGRWQIGRLALSPPTGVDSVEVQGLDVRWEWTYALQNRWWLSSVTADAITVDLGEPEAGSGNAVAMLYALWPRIPSLRVERLRVDRVNIERPRYPTFRSELDAQLDINWGALPARLLVGLTEQATQNRYALQLSAEAIDQLRLQGSLFTEPDTDWAAWLRWQLPQPAEANWDVRIDYSRPGYLSVDVDQWAMPWQNHMLQAKGQFIYDIDAVALNFSPLRLTMNDQPASLDGWIQAQSSQLSITIDDWVLDPFAELLGFAELQGRASLQAQWFGGWRKPRLDGNVSAAGVWQDNAFGLDMVSVADRASLRVTEGLLTLANNRFELIGQVDWITDELDFAVSGEVHTDPFFRARIPGVLRDFQGKATLSGQVQGLVSEPRIRLQTLGAGVWRTDDVRVKADVEWYEGSLSISDMVVYSPILQAEGSLRLNPQQWQADLAISEWRTDILGRLGVSFPVAFEGSGYGNLHLEGTGTEWSSSGELAIQGLWQQWPLNGQLNIAELDSRHIRLNDTNLQLGSSQARVNGDVTWAEQSLNLRVEHQDWPLSTLPPWLSFWPDILASMDGLWTGRTDITGRWNRPAIKTDSQLTGTWFAEPLSLGVVITPDSSEQWTVDRLDAKWLGAQWQYQGSLQPYVLGLDGQVRLSDLHMRQLPLLSREFTGKQRALPDSFDVSAGAQMSLRGKITEPNLSGQVWLTGTLDQQAFDAEADLGYLDTRYVDIRSANGQWANGAWTLEGLYDWSLNQFALAIETDTPNASHLVPWVQLAVQEAPAFAWLNGWQGSLVGNVQVDNRTLDWLIDGDLTSTGELYEDDYRVHWVGNGRLRQNLQHTVDAQWGVSEFTAQLQSDAQSISGDLAMQWLSYEQLRRFVPSVPETLEGLVNAQASIQGSLSDPEFQVELDTTGQIALESPHRFNAHLDVAGSRSYWQIDKTLFEIPRGLSLTVAGSGAGLQGELLLEGFLSDTSYWIANPEVGLGQAAFQLTAQGNLLQPNLTGSLDWRAANWPVSLLGNLRTEQGQYRINGTMLSDEQVRLKTNISSPMLALNLWPSQWRGQPLSISVALNSPMSVLDPFFTDQPDISIAGDVSGQFELSGSLREPAWNGELSWTNGRFEHAAYGSLLKDIQMSIAGAQTQWTIQGQGQDGRQGQVALNGGVQFLGDADRILAHTIDMAIDFTSAHLLNQAKMDAAVTGRLDVTGPYHNLLLRGDLSIAPLNMQSDTFLWDGAPQLNIVSSDVNDINQLIAKPFYWPDGNWDVTLLVNNRANLYGQGISAELTGELALTDNLYAPGLSGRFNLVRGSYTGLGRVFALQSGSVQIQNNQLVLDIQGEHVARMSLNNQLQMVPIQLRITGNQDALSLQLSSDTNLDQDELLAQLLFGKIVSDLDVLQAFQLASVVNKLRTGDTGFDPIGATRESFALDSLVVDTETNEEGNLQLNVSAGKYINDYLYLEVEQDVGSEQEFRGSLQFKVTPNTNLELYTQGAGGEFDRNGVELNWSWDY